MTLDTEKGIATGRSWRDLPAGPPEVEAQDPIPEATLPPPVEPVATTIEVLPPVAAPGDAGSAAPAPSRRPSAWAWVLAAALLVVLVAALFTWSPWSDDAPEAAGGSAIAGDPLEGVDEPIAHVAASLLPSVVQIEQPGGFALAVGSGFVYDDGGRILTAAHVVAGAREVTVRTSDGAELTGRVLGGDSVADVAVVEVDRDLPVAPLALGETPRVGQLAIAIGSPLGFEQSVTSGIVSAVDRTLDVPGAGRLEDLIQTDAPINQGNSGGPLADREGRVIGVNVAIATASGGSDGLGFAVAIDRAVEIAEQYTGESPDPGSLDPQGSPFPGFDDPSLLPPELRELFDYFLGEEFGSEPFTEDDFRDLLPDDLGGLLDELFPSDDDGPAPPEQGDGGDGGFTLPGLGDILIFLYRLLFGG